MPVPINYTTVLIAALASMVVGAIWYSPALFGKKWMSLIGLHEADKKGAGMAYLLSFIASLVMAYILAYFVFYTQAKSASDGVQLGFWVWLGFVGTTTLADVLWAKKAKPLYFIANGHHLIGLMVMGAILAAWK